MFKILLVTFLIITFKVSFLSAFPTRIPSAGVVERELEREYEGYPLDPDKMVAPIQIDIPDERLELPESITIHIGQFILNNCQAVPNDVIQSYIDEYLDTDLSLNDIYTVCQIVETCYAEHGYFLARAYPPLQTIENGCLTIEILEGVLGCVEVVDNCFYSTEFIRSYFAKLEGRPIHYCDFLRALLLLNDHCDLYATAIFKKGQDVGTADVVLRIADSYPAHLYLNGNNYGRNLTTHSRVGGRLDWGNILSDGDMFSIAQVVGMPIDAMDFTDIIYNYPLNYQGTSIEFAYLFSKFKIEELERLDLHGRTDIATLKVNHAWIRHRTLSVDIYGIFDYKQIQNFVLGTTSSFDKLRVLTVGATFDRFDRGFGRDYLTLEFAAGIPDFLGGLKAVSHESSRKGAGGRFYKFNLDYDRLQRLPLDNYFYFHASGQWTPNKLTQPEQIWIGGDGTVRGYPLAKALGDSGYYLNFEFRFPPPFIKDKCVAWFNKTWEEILQFDVFFDHGGVFLRSIGNTYLSGTGFGIRINGPYCLSFSMDVGFPLNHKHRTENAIFYIKLTAQPF